MKNPINAILIHTDGRTESVKLKTFSDFRTAVGGYVELVALPKMSHNAYVNEEGKLKGLPHNPKAETIFRANGARIGPADRIVGPVLIVGPTDNEGNDTDADELVTNYLLNLQQPATPTQENPMVAPFKSESEDDRPKYEEGTPFWVIGGAHNKDMYFQRRYDENATPYDTEGDNPSGKPYKEAYQFTPNLSDACLYFGEKLPKSGFHMGRKIAWKHKDFHNLPETEVRFYHGEIKNGVPVLDPCSTEHYYNTKEDNSHMKNRMPPQPEKPAEKDFAAIHLKIETFAKTLGVNLHEVLNHLIMQTVEDMAKDLGVSLWELTETHRGEPAFLKRAIEFNRELFKRSIHGNIAATEMGAQHGMPKDILGRFIVARKALQLLNEKVPHYANASLMMNRDKGPARSEREEVEAILKQLGLI